MKVFVATSETQGQRKNDFDWCSEGELVLPPAFTCDGGSVDDECGCSRSLAGLISQKATTTAKVLDLNVTPEHVKWSAVASREKGGWTLRAEAFHALGRMVDQVLAEADKFPAGAIVEFRDGVFAAREKR